MTAKADASQPASAPTPTITTKTATSSAPTLQAGTLPTLYLASTSPNARRQIVCSPHGHLTKAPHTPRLFGRVIVRCALLITKITHAVVRCADIIGLTCHQRPQVAWQ